MLKKVLIFMSFLLFTSVNTFADVTVDTWDSVTKKITGKTVVFEDDQWGAVQDLHNISKAAGEPDIIIGGDKLDAKELDKNVDSTSPQTLQDANNKAKKTYAENNPGNCKYDADGGGDIADALGKCLEDSALVKTDGDLKVTGGFKKVLIGWIQKIAGFLALGAIFAIVYGSLRLTLSMGEDEQIKKAKDIIKWGILGFLAVISAGLLIALIVNIMYSLGS